MSRTNKDVDSKVESGGTCHNNGCGQQNIDNSDTNYNSQSSGSSFGNNSGTINNTTNYYGNVGDFHLLLSVIKQQQEQIDRLTSLLEKTNILALEAINKTTAANKSLLDLQRKG